AVILGHGKRREEPVGEVDQLAPLADDRGRAPIGPAVSGHRLRGHGAAGLPRSPLPSPGRHDSTPECQAGPSPHIPGGCVVVLLRRTHRATGPGKPIRPHPRSTTRHTATSPGGTMTTPVPATLFTDPAPAQRLERAATALTAHSFTVEILDDAAAARTRIKDLIPEGASVFTGASETLRLSGIDADINTSGRYDAIKPRGQALDRVSQLREIWRLMSTPDVIVGSVHAVTETGSLVVASASGSQLPGYAGAAAHAIWIVGAQKVVPDLSTALRRVEDHCLPLESARAQAIYGKPSAINRLLILNAEPHPGRGTVLLLREAIGF